MKKKNLTITILDAKFNSWRKYVVTKIMIEKKKKNKRMELWKL